jgi:hypothetical protein
MWLNLVMDDVYFHCISNLKRENTAQMITQEIDAQFQHHLAPTSTTKMGNIEHACWIE